MNPLDLYARVEDMLGVKEAAPDLYAHYLLALQGIDFGSWLDVGCGNGDFLRQMQGAFPDVWMRGIDLSETMVAAAREQGIDAEAIDLCDVDDRYDVITAVFDVLNYLEPQALQRFGSCVQDRLKEGGYFLCDVNTLYGFEEVAVGAFFAEDSERFVTVDGSFEAGEYRSDFTLFERENGACWKPHRATIRQYEHSLKRLNDALGLRLVEEVPVQLYGEKPDKLFLVWRKAAS